MTNDSRRPLIGVTTSEVRRSVDIKPTMRSDPPRQEMALGLTYMRAIETGGGVPVVIPPLHHDAIEPLLDQIDGLCLSGGPDLDPTTYAQRAHPELGPTEPELDLFELAIARCADLREMPILAICRGAQALNVARGGTLVQHLPDLVDLQIEHRQREPAEQTTHDVEVVEESRLAAVLGETKLRVNSFHHQAADRVGSELEVVARAPDGIIEGLEASDREFTIGVQWHAETLVHMPRHLRLFKSFVEAAKEQRARSSA